MAIMDLLVLGLLAVAVLVFVQGRRAGGGADRRAATERDIEPLRSDLRELRARIQILERVITDTHGSADLNDEIERLRDR